MHYTLQVTQAQYLIQLCKCTCRAFLHMLHAAWLYKCGSNAVSCKRFPVCPAEHVMQQCMQSSSSSRQLLLTLRAAAATAVPAEVPLAMLAHVTYAAAVQQQRIAAGE
jgi:hypothetical protein